jgi:hypothetical protein
MGRAAGEVLRFVGIGGEIEATWRGERAIYDNQKQAQGAAPKERRFSNRRRAAASMSAWKSAPP